MDRNDYDVSICFTTEELDELIEWGDEYGIVSELLTRLKGISRNI